MKFQNIILKATVLCVIATTYTSCKKFTEVEPQSQYSLAQAFSGVSNATTALLGVYDELSGDNGYGIRINLYYPYDSDEGIVSGAIDNGRRGIGRYQLQTSNTELTNPFNQLYRGVEKANLCIDQIPQMADYNNGSAADQKELRRLHGEALTLRAQFLFELMRNWGDVPAPFVPSYKQTDLFIPAANRDETYDHLIDDLALAETLVPWRTEVVRNERITKGAVKAMRAKLALFRGGFSLRTDTKTMERRADYLKYYNIARDECAQIMAATGQHALNPIYEDVWHKYISAFTPDPVGEIMFEVGAGGGNSTSDSRMGNYDGPSINAASRYGTGGGGITMLPNFFYAFNPLDTRRDVTITTYAIGATNLKSMRRLGELTNGKFRRDWRTPLLPGTVLNLGYNWPIIRYADVLLMFAEADNEIKGAPSAEAKTAFEAVRRRAFRGNEAAIGVTPSDKAGFFNAIVNERYLEFGSEGVRKYDLIRWNLLASKIAETRLRITQIRDNVGEYANVPQYIYWKNNGEEIQYYANTAPLPTTNSPFTTTAVPNPTTGWTRTDWRQHLVFSVSATGTISGASIDNLPLQEGIARFFVPNKSELFPYTTAILDTYGGRLKQNPGY